MRFHLAIAGISFACVLGLATWACVSGTRWRPDTDDSFIDMAAGMVLGDAIGTNASKGMDVAPSLLARQQDTFPQDFPSFPQNRGSGRRFSRQPEANRADYPQWDRTEAFEKDVFTFARIQFDSYGGGFGGAHWRNDYPDCDWNFSFRLHELTSMKVDPDGVVLRLTDPRLFDYPFIYMSNVQSMSLSAAECEALRRYLLQGGFLMADDFWTPAAWRHVQSQMQQVLPDVVPQELPLEHPIFQLVYPFHEIPRIPSIRAWQRGDTFEYWHGDPEGDEDPHFQGYVDAQGRLMALFCHNNDVGDGFEREGENQEYFHLYSEKVSYPLGINIVIYALTH